MPPKITATSKLKTDDAGDRVTSPEKKLGDRFFRVRVDSVEAEVDINIPLILFKVASHLGNTIVGFILEEAHREMAERGLDLSKIDFQELVSLIDQGLVEGKLVDVDVEDSEKGRIKVEVYVE